MHGSSSVSAVAECHLTWLPFVSKALDHDLYGLRPKHRFLEQHPTLNDDLPNRIACGTIIVKPDIARLTTTGVEFVDGSSVDDVDVVILATGYTFSFPFLDESILMVKDNVVELYRRVFPPHLEQPTLAVVGLLQQLGPIFPIVEMQSRWVARVFKVITIPCTLYRYNTHKTH